MNSPVANTEDLTQTEATQRFFNGVLAKAVMRQVRYISIEPMKDDVAIFFRSDGVKKAHVTFPIRLYSMLVGHILSRIQVERVEAGAARLGRFSIHSPQGDAINVRIAFIPTEFGDRMEMRLFWADDKNLALSCWWKDVGSVAKWVRIIEQRGKIVFVGGPVDSGRSTTIYASLSHLLSSLSKIVFVEDPIDFPLERVTQMSVERNVTGGMGDTLSSALSLVPDVLAVSFPAKEDLKPIFDFARNTGSSVIVELSETSPLRILTWLKIAGISNQEIVDQVAGMVTQNLVRRLCRHCSQNLDSEVIGKLNELYGPDFSLARQAIGCERCGQSGFIGRELIYSILEIGSLVKPVVASGTWDDSSVLAGYSDLALTLIGLNHVRNGLTTEDELELRLGKNRLLQATKRQIGVSDNALASGVSVGNTYVPKLSELKASFWQSAQKT